MDYIDETYGATSFLFYNQKKMIKAIRARRVASILPQCNSFHTHLWVNNGLNASRNVIATSKLSTHVIEMQIELINRIGRLSNSDSIEVLEEYDVDLENVYNMDESGFKCCSNTGRTPGD